MARKLNPADIWSEVTEVGVFRDETSTPGDTTIDADVTAGSTVLSVADESNFATDDFLRIGDLGNEEIAKVASTSSGQITIVSELAHDHDSGETVHQVTKTKLGDISDDGIDVEYQADRTQLNAATRRERLGFLIGNVNARISFSLENHALENLMMALGIDEGDISGAGSASDPWKAALKAEDWDAQANQSFYFTGALKDGTTVEIHCSRTEIDPNKTITYARGQAAMVPVAADVGLVAAYQPSL